MQDSFQEIFKSSDDDLPIRVSTAELFDENDTKSQFLIEKLQAWMNFQGLVKNWFEDEKRTLILRLVFVPEIHLANIQRQENKEWLEFAKGSLKGLRESKVKSDKDSIELKINAYIAISNNELKEMMDSPASVETRFQALLKTASNELLNEYGFNVL